VHYKSMDPVIALPHGLYLAEDKRPPPPPPPANVIIHLNGYQVLIQPNEGFH